MRDDPILLTGVYRSGTTILSCMLGAHPEINFTYGSVNYLRWFVEKAIDPIKYKEIVLLHFDAHADLRESYNNEKYSHASAIKRCLDFNNVKVVSFGIRNLSEFEMNFYKKNKKRIKIFWAKDKKKWNLKMLSKLFKNKNVYITFDVDCLDSSIMPATGTPEPGGLLWEEVLPIIKKVCQISNILGADINELAPIKKFDSYNFLVAKLVYKIITYIFEFKK